MMCVARIKKIEAANNLLVTAAQMQIILYIDCLWENVQAWCKRSRGRMKHSLIGGAIRLNLKMTLCDKLQNYCCKNKRQISQWHKKKKRKKGDKSHMNMLGGRPEAHGMRGFMKEERSHVKAIFLEVCGFSEMRK